MKQPKRLLIKVTLAVLLILCAAMMSVVVKERIDSTDPDHTLPLIDVSVGYTKLVVPRAHYEWNYLTCKKYGPALSPENADLPLSVLDVMPGAPLVVTMSDPNYIKMKISRADGLYSKDYYEIAGTDILTPSTP
ncbi:MAG: hypothetical protein RSF90_04575, partial [Pygmaiobacter sp.]